MRASLLLKILSQYRPSLPVRVICNGTLMQTLSVVELQCLIMPREPHENVGLYGLHDFIVRERMKGFRSTTSREPELPFGEGPLADEFLELEGIDG